MAHANSYIIINLLKEHDIIQHHQLEPIYNIQKTLAALITFMNLVERTVGILQVQLVRDRSSVKVQKILCSILGFSIIKRYN